MGNPVYSLVGLQGSDEQYEEAEKYLGLDKPIYIQYGKPDQIEDYPFELSSKAYQIWYYYSIGERRRFIFVDEWSDGDFKLQYPYDGRSW